MNTPALLGQNRPNEQEYFLYEKFGFWVAYRWIYALLPQHPIVQKTMSSYEQTPHLFGRWLSDEPKICTVDKITENVIRKYIDDLMVRGKYTFYVNDLSKSKNCPDRGKDYRKPVGVTTINNYIFSSLEIHSIFW